MDSETRAAHLEDLASTVREQLLAQAHDGEVSGEDLGVRIRSAVDREAGVLSPATRDVLAARVAEQALGLGPLEPFLRDPQVDEILVSGTRPVWIERAGRLHETGAAFETEDALRHAIERLLAPAGRRVDESEPMCDARLPDGSRVNVVLPPLAVDGPALTIRRFRPLGLSAGDLVACGSWTPVLHDLLRGAVLERMNILVCGGTGSGKTTTLGALTGFLHPSERVITIEDTAELRLTLPHVVRLEARPASVEGRGEVTIRGLVRNALRMRPDRIVVGEVRGPEALDMLGAMATGHDGSLTTVHAGSPEEALRRLETLALMAGIGLPHGAVRAQVADALDLVVHQARAADGMRRVITVSEVVRVAGGAATREVYTLRGGRPLLRPSAGGSLAGRLARAA